MLHQTKSITLSRADIDSIGKDSSELSDEEFIKVGQKVGEAIMEDWWMALEEYTNNLPDLDKPIPLY